MKDMHSIEIGNSAITRIAVAGHGFEAWLTVNYVLAAFGRQNIHIQVCQVDGSDALDELYSVIPVRPEPGLDSIGISSGTLVRLCESSFSLGTRVAGQCKPYGNIGVDFLGSPFHHAWLRSYPGQGPTGYFSWSPATLAMQNNAFAPPGKNNAIGSLRHGMAHHVNVGMLTRLLRNRAMRNGVSESSGTLATVIRKNESDWVTGLQSDKGEMTEADLYLDCSGPNRVLACGTGNDKWIPAPGLPEFSISIEHIARTGTPPPYHEVSPKAEGWELEIPGNGWANRINLSVPAEGESQPIFNPGHVANPWKGNCLALGTASALLLPVEPVQFRLLSRSIRRMLSLLPGLDCAPEETAEFNHLTFTDLEEIQDLAAAYELARMQDKLNLSKQDTGAIHDSLKSRLRLFARRGRVLPGESDFLEPDDWAAALILLGLVPEKHDRLIDRLLPESLTIHMKKLKNEIQATASRFSPHGEYLNAVKSAQSK